MSKCANCVSDAKYDYYRTLYCEKHLPRFIRDRQGKVSAQFCLVHPDAVIVADPLPEPVFIEVPEEPEVQAPVAKKSATKAK